MLITRNDILKKHVDRNYYLEEKGGQIELHCFYDLVRYQSAVDFSNKDLTFREKQIEMAKKEIVDMITRDLKN